MYLKNAQAEQVMPRVRIILQDYLFQQTVSHLSARGGGSGIARQIALFVGIVPKGEQLLPLPARIEGVAPVPRADGTGPESAGVVELILL